MINKHAKEVLNIEADSIKALIKNINQDFEKAVKMILNCKGRVVVMGMGKSGIIARKIAATLSSTGTPAFFLHPAESIHGDIGMITSRDLIIILSYSGETAEVGKILPLIKKMKVRLISITGGKGSTLAKSGDVFLNVGVKKEACPYNIIPTSSTTAMLAMGDALAICVFKQKGLSREDFALFHPGGNIGRRLLKVGDIIKKRKKNPVIREEKSVKDALFVMTQGRLGAVSVVDKKGKLVGFFTDGDLRRHLQKKGRDFLDKKISQIMTKNPTTITVDFFANEAIKILKGKNFDNIPVVDKNSKPIGIIDERDLLVPETE